MTVDSWRRRAGRFRIDDDRSYDTGEEDLQRRKCAGAGCSDRIRWRVLSARAERLDETISIEVPIASLKSAIKIMQIRDTFSRPPPMHFVTLPSSDLREMRHVFAWC